MPGHFQSSHGSQSCRLRRQLLSGWCWHFDWSGPILATHHWQDMLGIWGTSCGGDRAWLGVIWTCSNSWRYTQCSLLTTIHVLKVDASLMCDEQRSLENLLQSFWDLESLRIVGAEKTLYDEFQDTVAVRDGRYEVSLPWKDSHKQLPDNFSCHLSLRGLLQWLRQSPDLLRQYDGVIQEQLKQGIIEPVPDTDSAGSMCHYLPHHAVCLPRQVYYEAASSIWWFIKGCRKTTQWLPSKGPKFNQL